MDEVMSMLANVGANQDNVYAAVMAVVMKPTDDNPNPQVDILTIGEDAVHMFGMSELVKMQLFRALEANQ